MTGGHDVGDIFWGTEDARAPARGSERAVHGWLCRLAHTRRIPCCHRGTLSARGGPPRPFSARSRRNTGQHRFIGLLLAFANLPLSTIEGGKAQPPHLVRRQAYRDYLVQIGVCRCSVMPEIRCADPALVVDFRRWLQKHRGAAEPTVRQYSRGAIELLLALGDDPTRWSARDVRAHFLERTARCGVGTAEKLVTSLR